MEDNELKKKKAVRRLYMKSAESVLTAPKQRLTPDDTELLATITERVAAIDRDVYTLTADDHALRKIRNEMKAVRRRLDLAKEVEPLLKDVCSAQKKLDAALPSMTNRADKFQSAVTDADEFYQILHEINNTPRAQAIPETSEEDLISAELVRNLYGDSEAADRVVAAIRDRSTIHDRPIRLPEVPNHQP